MAYTSTFDRNIPTARCTTLQHGALDGGNTYSIPNIQYLNLQKLIQYTVKPHNEQFRNSNFHRAPIISMILY